MKYCRTIGVIFFWLSALGMIGGIGGRVGLAEEIPHSSLSPEATLLLDKINDARENPRQVIRDLGLDPVQVLISFPQLAGTLDSGMAPLKPDSALCLSAGLHLDDMEQQAYFSRISLDGRTPQDRMRNAGYPLFFGGEALGLVSFLNFMQPEKGVDIIAANLLKAELDPDKGEPLMLLNPNFMYIGVAFSAGIATVQDQPFNAYKAVCDLAVAPIDGPTDAEEGLLLDKINAARENPRQTIIDLGLDPNQVLERFPQLTVSFAYGMAPLKLNTTLGSAARAHLDDMALQGYFDRISLDGRTPQDRMRNAGYPLLSGDEVLAQVSFANYLSPNHGVTALFNNMLKEELAQADRKTLTLFNPDYEEIGVAFVPVIVTVPGEPTHAYQTVCDAAVAPIVEPADSDDAFEQRIISELTLLLNQARANPKVITEQLAIDLGLNLVGLGDGLMENLNPAPPMLQSDKSEAFARLHAENTVTHFLRDFTEAASESYQSEFDNSIYLAAEAEAGEERGGVLSDSRISARRAAALLFEKIIWNQLRRTGAENSPAVLFKTDTREISIAVAVDYVNVGDQEKALYAVSVYMRPAVDAEVQNNTISGVLYLDADYNGFYSMGEELAGFPVIIKFFNGDTVTVRTQPSGNFSFDAERRAGPVTVTIPLTHSLLLEKRIVLQGDPVWLNFSLRP